MELFKLQQLCSGQVLKRRLECMLVMQSRHLCHNNGCSSVLQLCRGLCLRFNRCDDFERMFSLWRRTVLVGRIKFLRKLPRGLLHAFSRIKSMFGMCRRSLLGGDSIYKLELLLCLCHRPVHGSNRINCLYELCSWNLWRDDRALCLR